MGIILILPIICLSVWIIISTWRTDRDFFKTEYRRQIVTSLIFGVVLGLLFTFLVKYSFNEKIRFHGFPVPLEFVRTAGGKTETIPLSPVMTPFAGLANLLAGMAAAIFPLKVVLALKRFKSESAEDDRVPR